MRTLPFDCARCRPTEVAERCHQCLRWEDLPGQTWGMRTPISIGIKPDSRHCHHTPIEEPKQ